MTTKKSWYERRLIERIEGLKARKKYLSKATVGMEDFYIFELADLHAKIARLETRGKWLYGWQIQCVGDERHVTFAGNVST